MDITVDLLKERLSEIDWNVDVSTLDNNVPLNQQGLDSLDIITMLFFIEKEFSIEIPDSDVERLRSLEDVVEYINEKSGVHN